MVHMATDLLEVHEHAIKRDVMFRCGEDRAACEGQKVTHPPRNVEGSSCGTRTRPATGSRPPATAAAACGSAAVDSGRRRRPEKTDPITEHGASHSSHVIPGFMQINGHLCTLSAQPRDRLTTMIV